MENLMSLCVIALLVPTALTTLTLSLDHKRKSSQESKVIQVAQYVFSELPYCWRSESSILFPSTAAEFPSLSPSQTVSILFTSEGKPYTEDGDLKLGDMSWYVAKPDLAITDPPEAASGYIATITEAVDESLGFDTERTARFMVKVECPAGAPREARKSFIYYQLFSIP